MALKVSTGISKKLGLPDYCSVGASCHVEFELEASMLQNDLEAFQAKVRDAYIACCQAVSDELARHNELPSSNGKELAAAQTRKDETASPNGNGRPITDKQLKFISQLVGRISALRNGHLDKLTQRMFGKDVASLTSLEASGLIDTLKAIKDGSIDVGIALKGAQDA